MNKNKIIPQQFALYKYDNSTNIGDEIQSIAARRFLPIVNNYINRDEVGRWSSEMLGNKHIGLIANAWYMSEPFAWPIKNPNIQPLFVSVHIEDDIPRVKEAFSSPESIEYLKKYQPIGCRDESTEKFLQGLGIKTYFSGCLTLTLQRDINIKKQDYILVSGVSEAIYKKIKDSTKRLVIRIDSHSEAENSFLTAEKYLYLYQSAHCVVTSRLHAMLPSLALETPVLFVSDGKMTASKSRFEGYYNLTHHLTEKDYLSKPLRYDVNHPPDNPIGYKVLRKHLINKCYKFTGYNNKNTFAKYIDFKGFTLEDCLELILYNQDYLYDSMIRNKDSHITDLVNENRKLQEYSKYNIIYFHKLVNKVSYFINHHLFHR